MTHTPRTRIVNRIRQILERHGYPRAQMMLLVALTGGAGFLSAYLLLQLGFTDLWLRYLLAVTVAYVVFLILLWLWLRTSADDYANADGIDMIDLIDDLARMTPRYRGGGGQFGGGGTTGRFEHTSVEIEQPSESIDALDAASSADEFAIPIVIVLFVVGVVAASFTIVLSAPTLFAELLLDGALAATLYRRLRRLETRHWLDTAIRQTFPTFLATATVLVAIGAVIGAYYPEALTLGDALARIASD